MEPQLIGAIVAGIATSILLFLFICFFLTHACCPWRDVLMPWKNTSKLQWQLDRGDLDIKVEEPLHHHPVYMIEVEKPEPMVIAECPHHPTPTREDIITEEEEEEGEDSRVTTHPPPPPHSVEYEPSEKGDYEEPVRRPPSTIVSRIAAVIEERQALSGNFSYEHVQGSRQGTLSRIDEQNQLDHLRATSPTYSEEYDSHSTKQLTYINVLDDSSVLSSKCNHSPLLIRSSTRDPEISSMASSSKFHNMVRNFQDLSRTNSDASSKQRSELIYSRPDMLKKSFKSNKNPPIALADFLRHKNLPEMENAGPSIPPKDYEDFSMNS